jgi:hypothetical protein
MIRLIAVSAMCIWMIQSPPRLGSALVPGMQLVYASGKDTQPAWTVDSVSLNLALQGREGCSRVVIDMQANTPDERTLCRAGDTLVAWTPQTNSWTPQRSLGKTAAVVRPDRRGGRTTFEAEGTACESVGEARLLTVGTTVLSTDSAGKPIRRLRERYSLTLTTATSGTFELPDGKGWKVDRDFRLVALKYPSGTPQPKEC